MNLLHMYWMHEELLMAYQQNIQVSPGNAARYVACWILWNLWLINS
jgi:hypothetical protein